PACPWSRRAMRRPTDAIRACCLAVPSNIRAMELLNSAIVPLSRALKQADCRGAPGHYKVRVGKQISGALTNVILLFRGRQDSLYRRGPRRARDAGARVRFQRRRALGEDGDVRAAHSAMARHRV